MSPEIRLLGAVHADAVKAAAAAKDKAAILRQRETDWATGVAAKTALVMQWQGGPAESDALNLTRPEALKLLELAGNRRGGDVPEDVVKELEVLSGRVAYLDRIRHAKEIPVMDLAQWRELLHWSNASAAEEAIRDHLQKLRTRTQAEWCNTYLTSGYDAKRADDVLSILMEETARYRRTLDAVKSRLTRAKEMEDRLAEFWKLQRMTVPVPCRHREQVDRGARVAHSNRQRDPPANPATI